MYVLKIFASSSMIASVILKENVVIWEYFNKTIKSDSHKLHTDNIHTIKSLA